MRFELLDDDLALQNALAFIDACDQSAPPALPPVVALPEQSPRIVSRFSSRKAELEVLRHEVKMLGAEPKQQREKSRPQLPRPAYGSPCSEDESLHDELMSMWKSVAVRQRQRRSHSENTNRKLKQALAQQALAHQIQVAKALEGLSAALDSKRKFFALANVTAVLDMKTAVSVDRQALDPRI